MSKAIVNATKPPMKAALAQVADCSADCPSWAQHEKKYFETTNEIENLIAMTR